MIGWAVAADEPSLARNTAGRLPDAAAASTRDAERLEAGRPAIRRIRHRAVGGRHNVIDARELGDADDRCAAVVDVGGASGPGRGDAIVDDAGLDGGAEATRRLDLLEHVPRPLGELRR